MLSQVYAEVQQGQTEETEAGVVSGWSEVGEDWIKARSIAEDVEGRGLCSVQPYSTYVHF